MVLADTRSIWNKPSIQVSLLNLRQQRGLKVVLAYVTSPLVKMHAQFQNEVHALLFCQDHRVSELNISFSFCLHLNLRTSQQLAPVCCNRSTTNFLSQQNTRISPLFLKLNLTEGPLPCIRVPDLHIVPLLCLFWTGKRRHMIQHVFFLNEEYMSESWIKPSRNTLLNLVQECFQC